MEASAGHEGALLKYAGESPATEARKITVGFAMYIATDVVLAVMFFIGYIWLRQYNTNGLWFPSGVTAPPTTDLLWPAIALAVSSLSYAGAQVAVRQGNQSLMRILLSFAFLIMLGVLIWQIVAMGRLPITNLDGGFATAYLLLLGYHILHMAIAVLVGIGVVNHGLRGKYTEGSHVGLDVAGIWWHWVVTYAVLFWLLVVMLPPSLYYG